MSVFISYRRDDTAHVAGRLYDRLVDRFGSAAVFKDVDSIPAGVDFRMALHNAVKQARVVVVLIGPRFDGGSTDGVNRLTEPTDFVRIELESALSQGIPVIPVLVDGGRMLSADKLPASLQDLVYRQALNLRPDPDFHADAQRVCRAIEENSAARPQAVAARRSKPADHPLPMPQPPKRPETSQQAARSGIPWPRRTIQVSWIFVLVAVASTPIVWNAIQEPDAAGPSVSPPSPAAPTLPPSTPAADPPNQNDGRPPSGSVFDVELSVVRFVTEVQKQLVTEGNKSREVEVTVDVPFSETKSYTVVRYPVVERFTKDGLGYYRIILSISENETLTVIASEPPQSVKTRRLRSTSDEPVAPMPAPAPMPPETTLYDRLGGEKAITAVVDEFIALVAADEKVNFFRKGTDKEWKPGEGDVKRFKAYLVNLFGQLTGGPQEYTGRDLHSAHAGMRITTAEFNALAGDLIAALDKFSVPQAEKDELIKIVASTAGDIIELP